MKRLRALSVLIVTLIMVGAAPAAARAEGHLDREFGKGGIRYLPESLREPRGVALLGDGRVAYADEGEVAALSPSGELDPEFGDDGLAKVASTSSGSGPAAASRGAAAELSSPSGRRSRSSGCRLSSS